MQGHIKGMKFPLEYFITDIKEKECMDFKFTLEDSLLNAIKQTALNVGVTTIDFFVSSFIYLLSEITAQPDITLYTMINRSDLILPIQMDLSRITNFHEYLQLVEQELFSGSEAGVIHVSHLDKPIVPEEKGNSIIPILGYADNIASIGNEIFDIVFTVFEDQKSVNFNLSFNAERLKKNKVEEMIYDYIEVMKLITKVLRKEDDL
jgi:hypothetical protein